MADDTIGDLIDTAASTPQSVSGDTGSLTNRPIKDMIEADKYLAAKRRAKNCTKILCVKAVPPGAYTNLSSI